MHDIGIDARSIRESADFESWIVDDYRYLIESVHRIDVAKDKDFQAKLKSFWGYSNYEKEWSALLFDTIGSTISQSGFSFKGILQVFSAKRVEKSTVSKVLADFDKPYLRFFDLPPVKKNDYQFWGLGKRFEEACKAGR